MAHTLYRWKRLTDGSSFLKNEAKAIHVVNHGLVFAHIRKGGKRVCGLLAEDPFSVLTLCLLSAMNNSFERKRAAEMESCFSFLYLGIGIKETFPNFLTVYCLCGFKEEASNSLEEKGNIKGLKKKLGLGITFVVSQIGTTREESFFQIQTGKIASCNRVLPSSKQTRKLLV